MCWSIFDVEQRPIKETINFSKLEIENHILKFEIGSLKRKIKKLKNKLKNK